NRMRQRIAARSPQALAHLTPGAPGHWKISRRRAALHAHCSPSDSLSSWANRLSHTSNDGGCSSAHACLPPPTGKYCRWHTTSDTNRKRRSAERSSAASELRQGGIDGRAASERGSRKRTAPRCRNGLGSHILKPK